MILSILAVESNFKNRRSLLDYVDILVSSRASNPLEINASNDVSVPESTTNEAEKEASFMQVIEVPILRPEHGEFGFSISGGHPLNIRVDSIQPDSAAIDMIRVNDIIVAIGGNNLTGMSHADIIQLILSLPLGQETLFTLLREKKKAIGKK